jgi:hypothetical protein
MSNPFAVTVRLQQHSPLIHFQHDQPGATLRATELKPKLDKFIIDKCFENDFTQYKKYLVGYNENLKENQYNHHALDYKIKIIVDPEKVNKRTISIITMEKTSVCYPANILEIFSFKTELPGKIKEVIDDFFILHNFGLRQSKGFGCFTTTETGQTGFEKTVLGKYPVFYKKKMSGQDIYSEIDTDYKILKSGINHKKYIKSKLFEYMCEKKQIGWEKRKIKETLKTQHPNIFNSLMHRGGNKGNRIAKCEPGKKEPDCRYIRALLGLAEHNEFRTWKGKIQINIKDNKGEIERFQSPLMFKVFNQTIYILPNEIPHSMFNRDFDFLLDDEKLFTIPTPRETQYSIIEFLDFSLFHNTELKGWERIAQK